MDTERITDGILHRECESIAQDIFDEMLGEMEPDETPEHYESEMSDRAHERVDGHQWVIYHHYAHQIAGGCNAERGEQWLEDLGMPENPTYDGLAVIIAYGEMVSRVQERLFELVRDYEPEENGEAA